jgi:HEAT repeat protein
MRAFPLIEARTAYGTPEYERNAAIAALARLGAHAKKPKLALALLEQLAQHDALITTRISATRALGLLGDPAAIPVLRRIEANDSQQAVQRSAFNSIYAIGDMQRMKHRPMSR